jgi:hypothetical protein
MQAAEESKMKADQLQAAIRNVPFRPFVIHTASGESYPVNHPERCSISQSGRSVGVWLDHEDMAIIDMESITEFVAKSSGGRRGRASSS